MLEDKELYNSLYDKLESIKFEAAFKNLFKIRSLKNEDDMDVDWINENTKKSQIGMSHTNNYYTSGPTEDEWPVMVIKILKYMAINDQDYFHEICLENAVLNFVANLCLDNNMQTLTISKEVANEMLNNKKTCL